MIKPEDIIAIKRYQVPFPPEDLFTAFDASINHQKNLTGCTPWLCTSQGNKMRHYIMNPKHTWVIIEMGANNTKTNELQVMKKYDKDAMKYTNETHSRLTNGTPTEVRVLITQINELGIECKAYCYPALYTKLRRKLEIGEIDDFIIQDSKFNSELFLDELFIGKLGGTVVEDFIKRRFEYKLLINDSNRREITDEIDKLLDSATTEISICGWMGTHYLPKLTQIKNQGVKVSFMIHRPSEAKGRPWKSEIQEARKTIVSNFGIETISDAHNIHGRTIIVDNKAIIGSLDMNSASLTGAHLEFAILTDDPEIVRRMRAVFNSKFQPLSTTE